MGRRGDHIRKRKDGRWEGRYCIERRKDGTIRYGSVYGRTHKEVKAKLANITPGDVFNGTKGLTFEHLAKLWLDSNRIRLKGSTIQKYEFLLNTHIFPELGKIRLSQLTSAVVNSFLCNKAENGRKNSNGSLSASYMRTITLILKSVIRYGVKEKLCTPLNTEIHQPPEQKRELHILSKEDQQKLEKHLTTVITPVNAGILLSLNAGLRIGEVCALTWNDVDLKERIIHIRSTVTRVGKNDGTSGTKLIIGTPKTKSSVRDIPITSVIFNVLTELKSISVSKYVISESESFMSPRTYDYRYHKILKQCDIQAINYHALRHTFATRCIESKMDVKTLSEILGHGKVSVTLDIYVHSSMEQKRKQMEDMVIYNSSST